VKRLSEDGLFYFTTLDNLQKNRSLRERESAKMQRVTTKKQRIDHEILFHTINHILQVPGSAPRLQREVNGFEFVTH
jgi:hypothetical protein